MSNTFRSKVTPELVRDLLAYDAETGALTWKPRDVTGAENSRNQKRRSENTSGFTGVSLHKRTGKWVAMIKGAGRVRNLGYYATKEEAHAARLAANVKFGFHPNHGRAT